MAKWVTSDMTCQYCGHHWVAVYPLLTPYLQCACGGYTPSTITRVFRSLHSKEITFADVPKLIQVPYSDTLKFYRRWRAVHYPRTLTERLISLWWRLSALAWW